MLGASIEVMFMVGTLQSAVVVREGCGGVHYQWWSSIRRRVAYGLPKVKIKRSEGMGGVEGCSRVRSEMVGVVRSV